MTYSILWGRTTHLDREINPATELGAWAKYRELATTHYAALLIEGRTVAHNLTQGPVIGCRDNGEVK